MAEFVQMMKDWRRMCKAMTEMDGCEDCPITRNTRGARCGDMPGEMEKIEDIIREIEKWSKENPEPVYPTWGTWLGAKFGFDLREIMYTPIPADIAEKLEIEPKE